MSTVDHENARDAVHSAVEEASGNGITDPRETADFIFDALLRGGWLMED